MTGLGKKESWREHPQYLADASALFGGHPHLKCRGCEKLDYELFYGHCKKCADEKGIPKQAAEPQTFHDALKSGTTRVAQGVPKVWYPVWHWRRWLGTR